jgi:hypothetical protein
VVLVTVADEPGALPEAHRRFAEWVAERLPDLGMNEAFSVSGPVISRREA